MGRPPGVALVGCGPAGSLLHAPALRLLQANNEVSVAAVVDPDKEARDTVAAKFPEAESAASLDDLKAKIDVAIVAAPTPLHRALCEALFARGCDVLCEKPLAGSPAEAQAILAAARNHARILAVGQVRRFYPATRLLRRLIQGRSFGRLLHLQVVEGDQFTWPVRSDAFFRPGNGGGLLRDLGIHVLDLLLWWCGEPEEIDYADDAMGGVEATCRIRCRLPQDVTAELRLTREVATRNLYRFTFEEAEVTWHIAEPARIEIRPRLLDFEKDSELRSLAPRQVIECEEGTTVAESYALQLRDFLRAVREGTPPTVDGEEGLAAVALIEACYESRRLIELPWMSPEDQARAEALS